MTRSILFSLCFVSFGMFGLVGCGDSGTTLKGKATIDGQPFVGTIHVTNPTTNQTAAGTASEKDGSFTVANAPVGQVIIHVEPGVIPKDPSLGHNRPLNNQAPKGLPPKDAPESDYPPYLNYLAKNPALRDALERSEKVDPKFKSATESPLKTEIKPGTNQFDVPLTSGQ
jgi:hypothetical protein